jgi:hypothetical protein
MKKFKVGDRVEVDFEAVLPPDSCYYSHQDVYDYLYKTTGKSSWAVDEERAPVEEQVIVIGSHAVFYSVHFKLYSPLPPNLRNKALLKGKGKK